MEQTLTIIADFPIYSPNTRIYKMFPCHLFQATHIERQIKMLWRYKYWNRVQYKLCMFVHSYSPYIIKITDNVVLCSRHNRKYLKTHFVTNVVWNTLLNITNKNEKKKLIIFVYFTTIYMYILFLFACLERSVINWLICWCEWKLDID